MTIFHDFTVDWPLNLLTETFPDQTPLIHLKPIKRGLFHFIQSESEKVWLENFQDKLHISSRRVQQSFQITNSAIKETQLWIYEIESAQIMTTVIVFFTPPRRFFLLN